MRGIAIRGRGSRTALWRGPAGNLEGEAPRHARGVTMKTSGIEDQRKNGGPDSLAPPPEMTIYTFWADPNPLLLTRHPPR